MYIPHTTNTCSALNRHRPSLAPLGSSFWCPKTMPHFFKEEKQQRVAWKFPSRKQKLGTTLLLGCIPDEGLIYPREHNTLSKNQIPGGNFGHLLRRSGTALFLNRLSPTHSVSQIKVLSYSKWGQPDCFPSPEKGLKRAPQLVTEFFSPKTPQLSSD